MKKLTEIENQPILNHFVIVILKFISVHLFVGFKIS